MGRGASFAYANSVSIRNRAVRYSGVSNRKARGFIRTVSGSYGPTFVRVNRVLNTNGFHRCCRKFNFDSGAKVSLPNRTRSDF